jgi:hypothetical protein
MTDLGVIAPLPQRLVSWRERLPSQECFVVLR